MYAIVEIAGQQYKVEKDQQVFVNRLEGKEGSKVSFDNVLLTADGDKIEVGAPAVKGVSVSAKIVEHLKGDKVIVFKKKRRKGYKVRNGHRQYLSKIEIESIGASKAKSSATKATKKADDKKAEVKAETKSDAKPKTSAKKSTTKKATEKKPTAKKEAKPKAKKSETKDTKAAASKKADKKEDK